MDKLLVVSSGAVVDPKYVLGEVTLTPVKHGSGKSGYRLTGRLGVAVLTLVKESQGGTDAGGNPIILRDFSKGEVAPHMLNATLSPITAKGNTARKRNIII